LYNLVDETITIAGKTEAINDYVVWWSMPYLGLFEHKADAIEAWDAMNETGELPPAAQVIGPVCVAVGETLYEPVTR